MQKTLHNNQTEQNTTAQLAGAVEPTDCNPAKGKNLDSECPVYDTKQSDGVAPVMQRTTSMISQCPIYGSNRTVWYLNWMLTNDLHLTELLEIELSDLVSVMVY